MLGSTGSDDHDNRARLNALFSMHGQTVLNFAVRRARNLADAEDAVAETFLVAWRRLEDVPEHNSLPWLLGVCRRILANQRRAIGRRASLLARLARVAPRDGEVPDHGTGVAAAALARLTDSDRELLQLIAWEQLSYSEIAVTLGITTNAVAVRAHRARARFRTEFAKAVSNRVDPDTLLNDAED